MPRMQVTFNNASRGPRNASSTEGAPTSVLTFQIDYRGKTYDCVGHLRPVADEGPNRSKVKLAGYFGYNGPIDIQKLQKAAEDYYHTVVMESGPELRVVRTSNGHIELNAHKEYDFNSGISKAYEFNVGKIDFQALQKAV